MMSYDLSTCETEDHDLRLPSYPFLASLPVLHHVAAAEKLKRRYSSSKMCPAAAFCIFLLPDASLTKKQAP